MTSVGMASLLLLSHGCRSTDAPELAAPETVVRDRIERGFNPDFGVGPTMGHSVPVEGEIISTPPCVAEARGGQECKR